jgi:hypothetical protein
LTDDGVSPASIPAVATAADVPAATLHPHHGASSLPGGWLPCGFPTWSHHGGNGGGGWGGGGGSHQVTAPFHEASCSVALAEQGSGIRHFDNGPGSWVPGFRPQDLVQAYHLPSGAGQTVAIVDAYDDPRVESDLNVYRSQFGLPPCTSSNGCFRKLNEAGKPGPYPAGNAAWSNEITLDTEMVSAVCPHCPILLIEANSDNIDDLGASVDKAVALGARVVSNSYYAVEWSGERGEDVHYNHPGVAITVSSGDQAALDGVARTANDAPYYPAASPYVTAVGGTMLVGSGRGGDGGWGGGGGFGWHQVPWVNEGSGCSRYESRPAFQTPVCGSRSSVDMAVVADPRTGVAVYISQAGGWTVAGGTSVGAPIVAAAYALSGNPSGPSFAYAHHSDFGGILPPGFNEASGLGSPMGVGGL